MSEFLTKQIPYNYSLRKQVLIASILGIILGFIMVFLLPFDTFQFDSNYKYLILSGFGFLLSILYLICAKLENVWYIHENKKWKVKHEIVSFLFFVFISSILIHFYNQVFLNDFINHEYREYEYVNHGLWFFRHSIIPIMLIILPFYLYFRNKFGDLIISKPLNEIEFCGLNKGEKIHIKRETLLFIKSSENYIEIFYIKNGVLQQEIFRNTLTAISKQAPFLYQCHRSYLVNISTIKVVKGNSQNAKIKFHFNELDIPLSKSYYKIIKSVLSI